MKLSDLKDVPVFYPEARSVGFPVIRLRYRFAPSFDHKGNPKKGGANQFTISFNAAFAEEHFAEDERKGMTVAISPNKPNHIQFIFNPPPFIEETRVVRQVKKTATTSGKVFYGGFIITSVSLVKQMCDHLGINMKDHTSMNCPFNFKLVLDEEGTKVFECTPQMIQYDDQKTFKRAARKVAKTI